MSRDAYARVAGKTVQQVEITDSDSARIIFTDGSTLALDLAGDCCSCSYFSPEGIQALKELPGAKVLSVEERGGPSKPGLPEQEDYNEISWHFLVFTTDRGHVTVDWRNDSNGYYDGYVIPAFWEAVSE